MPSMHREPGKHLPKKPRKPAKEEQMRKRRAKLVLTFWRMVTKIDGLPEPENGLRRELWKRTLQGKDRTENLALKTYLEKKGMGKEWRKETQEQAMKISQQAVLDAAGLPDSVAITGKEKSMILKKVRRFMDAIKEAENAGIA